MITKTVMIEEAVNHLSDLLNLVDQGEEVVICRENRPKVKLVSLADPPKERVFGQFRGQIWMSPDFDEPLPDPFWFGEGRTDEKTIFFVPTRRRGNAVTPFLVPMCRRGNAVRTRQRPLL